MFLQRFGLTWEMLLGIAGVGVAVFVTLVLARRLAVRIFGPVFEYETLRLARKGHTFWLRTAVVILIFGLLYMAKPEPQSHTRLASYSRLFRDQQDLDATTIVAQYRQQVQAELERFAGAFTQSFMLAAAIGVMLITPLYFSSAVSEEKEKRTLDFLLATELTSGDIVIGKLAARLLNLVGVLLAALPILALTQLWGSVDWRFIAYGFTLILFMLISYACFGIGCSVVFARTRNAVLACYVVVITLNLVTWLADIPQRPHHSAISLLQASGVMFASLEQNSLAQNVDAILRAHGVFAGFHFMLLLAGLFVATAELRYFAARHVGRPRRVVTATSAAVVPHPLTIAPNPPLRGDPLVWKERYLGRTVGAWFLGGTFWLFVYLILGVFIGFGFLIFGVYFESENVRALVSPINFALRGVFVAMALLMLLGISLRLASSVSREREQDTLVSLFTLPISRERILRAKWFGALERARLALIGLAMACAVAGLFNGFGALSCFVLPCVFASHVWFFGNLGLLLSNVCRSTNRAYSLLVALFVLVVAASWVWTYLTPDRERETFEKSYLESPGDQAWLRHNSWVDIDDWASPPQTWWKLTQRAPESELATQHYLKYLGHVLGAMQIYIVAGLGCLGYSLSIFRRKR